MKKWNVFDVTNLFILICKLGCLPVWIKNVIIFLSQIILFGLAVSIDSFSVGLGLDTISKNILLSSFIFSLSIFIFTITGLFIGKKINQIFGKISTLIGGCVLILIATLYIL